MTKKRILSFILTIMLLMSICVPAMAANAKEYKRYTNYLCIGDSIAAGCGLTYEGQETVFGDSDEDVERVFDQTYMCWGFSYDVMKNAYHSLVANALGANLRQRAISGMRAVELRYLLTGVYNDYDKTYSWANTWYKDGDKDFTPPDMDTFVKNMGVDYEEEIRNADIITLNLGSNDVFSSTLTPILEPLTKETGPGLQRVKDFLGNILIVGPILNGIIGAGELTTNVTDFLNTFRYEIGRALNQFKVNYTEVVNRIYEINPNVTIVSVGAYNPLSYTKLSEENNLDISGILNATLLELNTFIASFSSSYENYYFADVMGTELYEQIYSDPRMWDYFSVKEHPNLAGHKFMARQILNALPEQKPLSFTDVPADFWAYDDIQYVVDNKIMLGKTDTTFEPNSDMTRAQFITILYRLAGSPSITGYAEPFLDVNSNYWAYKAIVWGYNKGIINGVSENMFNPNGSLSRQQLVTMLYRYEGKPEITGYLSMLDASSISEYAREAVIWALSKNIVTGYSDNTFGPMNIATRAHMSAIVSRYVLNAKLHAYD